MDEDFEYFLEKMGPPIERKDVPESSIERYRGKLPDQLLTYWEEHGWCGYGDGLFWTVNPEEYESVLEAWLNETFFMEEDAYHLIARSAMGKLYFWGEQSGYSLKISAFDSLAIPRKSLFSGDEQNMGVRVFFSHLNKEENDFESMFPLAFKKLGKVNSDEMYGFIPALAFGGTGELETIQKVKAVEHLVLLAQLAPLRILEY